ncbi:SRPBCC domain-containing protein [candidate division KSB1 bacterium]|nr:SRPBCC domain-containing protein [candidate division KSB1 bacterium]
MPKQFTLSTEIYASAARVWEELTTQKGLAHWFSETGAVEPRVGGTFKFKGNFVYGWRAGEEFATKITAFDSERQFGFEFPLRHADGSVTDGVARFELAPAGKSTSLDFSFTFDSLGSLNPYCLSDIWAYYLNILTNVCEHEWHEPGLHFDFSRPWTGNIRHVIYTTGSPDQVFDHLHKPELLAKYFNPVKLFEPRENGRIDFGWGEGSGPSKVLAFEPPYELAYDWPVTHEGGVHTGLVKWTIEPEGRQVRVEMKQSGFLDGVDHFASGEALGWANLMLELRRLIESGRPALNQQGKIEDL